MMFCLQEPRKGSECAGECAGEGHAEKLAGEAVVKGPKL